VPLADFGDTPSNSGVKLEPYFEVLLRLRDSQGRLLAPDAFLPTAERFGMMLDIDRWVIHNALRALRETARQGRRVKLSLNLSAQSLINPATASFVTDKLVEFDVEARQLVFEITESRAVSNLESARALIGHLRALGCQFALDDFGVGFSTFSHLKHLDVDFLKIDGSFIQGLVDDKVDQAVVKAITGIAHSVGKLTVAEFVDRPQILPLLRDCAVDYIRVTIGEPQVGLERALPFARGHRAQMREAAEPPWRRTRKFPVPRLREFRCASACRSALAVRGGPHRCRIERDRRADRIPLPADARCPARSRCLPDHRHHAADRTTRRCSGTGIFRARARGHDRARQLRARLQLDPLRRRTDPAWAVAQLLSALRP
jgi:EAL domain-containing protein (putative c-di-GMP-specific phosphodiesterase class I)